jgi:hypothetical protein
MANRAGTEMYVHDLARALLRRGHRPVVFSTRHGVVAEALRAATIPVVDDLAAVREPPDIIHGHHHLETMTALLHFPGVPGVYFCHGWLPWEETPVRFPRLLRYVAVDETCRDRLVLEGGVPPDRVDVILNAVDLERFRARAPLPERPRRALVFANEASEATQVPLIRRVCEARGIALDVAGIASGNVVASPETALPLYDLVFARARAALEAMAVGAAVVLCNWHRLGGLVTSRDFDRLRAQNFGIRALDRPIEEAVLAVEIDRYDAADAGRVSARVRAEAALEPMTDRIVDLYEHVRAQAREAGSEASLVEEERAAAAYLRWLGPAIKTGELQRHRDALLHSISTMQSQLEAARHEMDAARLQLRTAQDDVAAAQNSAGTQQREIEAMRRTLTWRVHQRIFARPWLAGMYRRLRRTRLAP